MTVRDELPRSAKIGGDETLGAKPLYLDMTINAALVIGISK